MAGFEQTIIIGNVGRSPEVKQVNDTTVCNFSVAVNTVYGSGNNRRESTNWYRVAAWGKLADVCQQYVTKGMQVMVTGAVEARAYIGKDGEAKAELSLRAREVKFLSGGNDSSDNDDAHGSSGDIPF